MGLDGNPPRKCTPARVKNCLKTFLVHLFSHVGLCVLVVGYAVIGGFIFKELEHRTEEEDKMEAEMADAELNETRRQHVSNLWVITDRLNVLYESNWTLEVEAELEKFEKAVKDRKNLEHQVSIKWTFTSALLYSVSIITTIGYGHIFPQTLAGKMFTMLYAVFGVPIMLLWVSNIGNVMAHAFKFAYFHAPFCGGNREESLARTAAVQSQRSNRTRHKMKSLKKGSTIPTEVQFSLNDEKCETILVEEGKVPSPASSQQSPSESTRKSKIKKSSLTNLDPTARQILFECAEYNLRQGEEPESRDLIEQLNSIPQDEVDDSGSRSSEVESVIEVMAGRLRGPSPIPPPPSFELDPELTSPNFTGGGKIKESLKLPAHGTPSRVPLLENTGDVIEIEPLRPSGRTVREYSSFNEKRVPVSLVLFVVVLYIVLGAAVFTAQERWNFWDSAYFCFITLSTIGLGDMTPGKSLEHSGTKESTVQLIFCCFYLVVGLAIIAMSFNLVQEQVTLKVTGFARRIGIIEDDYD